MAKVFRFASNLAMSDTSITVANLLNLLVVALTAATTTRLFRSIRLRKVEAWAIGAQSAASEVIQISGLGDGPANFRSDVSMGITPAHVIWRPAPMSRSSLWYDTGSSEADNLFDITVPVSAIVDVTVEFIVQNPEVAGPAAGPIPAGATPGSLYGCTLDGGGLAGHLVPSDYVLLP